MFALWITGRPASGKSTLAAAVARVLREHGTDPVVLESDALRRFFTPRPTYSEEERDAFYAGMRSVGELFVRRGIPVIFDATAHRRAYRDRARSRLERFLEVLVDTPLEACRQRDPKGIYQSAANTSVPGVHVPYEAPETPDVIVRGDREDPDAAAERIVAVLAQKGWVSA
jgi:adenylylsulfate kinase